MDRCEKESSNGCFGFDVMVGGSEPEISVQAKAMYYLCSYHIKAAAIAAT